MNTRLKTALIVIGAALLAVLAMPAASKLGYGSPVAQNWLTTTDGGGPAATTTRFFGAAIPDVNNLYDLGTPTLSWRNVYASGTVSGSMSFTATTSFPGINLTTAGGNITYNGANAKRSLILTGAGAMSSFTSGAGTSTQFELATNKVNMRLPGFNTAADNYVEWTVVMPDNYDGGAMTGSISFFATSTVNTASSTVWGIQAACTTTGGYMDQAWGTMATSSKQNIAQFKLHTVPTVTFTPAYPAGGSVCQFRVGRIGTAAADTHIEALGLVAAKVEYSISQYSD